MEELLEKLKEVSALLRSPSLHLKSSRNRDVEKKIEDFELLVEKLKFQHANSRLSDIKTKEILINLSELMHEINVLCDLKLENLNFLDQLKPLN